MYPSCLHLFNQRGVFWVEMCPAIRTQWTTPLIDRLSQTSLSIFQWHFVRNLIEQISARGVTGQGLPCIHHYLHPYYVSRD